MTDKDRRLIAVIRRLAELSREAGELAQGNPAAERNIYMIRQHLQMLEIEVCEPFEVIEEGDREDDR